MWTFIKKLLNEFPFKEQLSIYLSHETFFGCHYNNNIISPLWPEAAFFVFAFKTIKYGPSLHIACPSEFALLKSKYSLKMTGMTRDWLNKESSDSNLRKKVIIFRWKKKNLFGTIKKLFRCFFLNYLANLLFHAKRI